MWNISFEVALHISSRWIWSISPSTRRPLKSCWKMRGKASRLNQPPILAKQAQGGTDEQMRELMALGSIGCSDGLGAEYCFLNAVSGLSSEMKNTAEQLTWTFSLQSKCYPPYTSCINGTELACAALKRGYNNTKETSLGKLRSQTKRSVSYRDDLLPRDVIILSFPCILLLTLLI